GRCGHHMSTRYCGPRSRATYFCRPNVGHGAFWSVSAPATDRGVSRLFLDVLQPPEIELSLAVHGPGSRMGCGGRAPGPVQRGHLRPPPQGTAAPGATKRRTPFRSRAARYDLYISWIARTRRRRLSQPPTFLSPVRP